jgi:DNA polymerase-2
MTREIEAFILTGSSFEVQSKQMLKLYGQSSEGSLSLIIDSFENYFFREVSIASLSIHREDDLFTSLSNVIVEKVFVKNQTELKQLVQEAQKNGLKVFESDIRPLERFLMDHRIYSQVKLKGEVQNVNGHLHLKNPEILSGDYYPEVKIYSFDIETGRDGKLLSLAYDFRSKNLQESKTIVLGEGESTKDVHFHKDEKGILHFFEQSIARLDPDIITGWNVIGFDFHFLFQKSKELKCPLFLGKNKKPLEMFQNAKAEWQVFLEGRVIIDGPRALKMNFFNFESYKLNAVAKILLGEGKDIDEDDDYNKWDEIERRYREDKLALARYNVLDAKLVLDIFEKTKIIDLLLNRSLISGMLIDRVGGSTASFDHFYLPELHLKKMVASNVFDIEWSRQAKGGFVLNPIAGIHENVLVLDFKSLYPTVIQTFSIDPLSRFKRDVFPKMTPVNLSFSSTEHILPGKIHELLHRRSLAKKENNINLSQAIKILMNSFYGVMGSSGCRFYHEDLPDGITGSGQWILKTVISHLESLDFKVIYGDTDSIFVKLKSRENYQEVGGKLVEKINQFLCEKIKKEFQLNSKLEIQFDKFFHTLILMTMRGQEEGAKKRYAGLMLSHKDGIESKEMVLTGMEYVRSDWSLLAKKFQFELIRRVFFKESLDDYILSIIEKLENKKLDDELVISKRLSKPLSEYIKNIPPHAKAAKILFETKGILKKKPQYVMTFRGAIPIECPHDDIDYEYYIERQLAPVAESILSLYGKTFKEIRGGQLSLF